MANRIGPIFLRSSGSSTAERTGRWPPTDQGKIGGFHETRMALNIYSGRTALGFGGSSTSAFQPDRQPQSARPAYKTDLHPPFDRRELAGRRLRWAGAGISPEQLLHQRYQLWLGPGGHRRTHRHPQLARMV